MRSNLETLLPTVRHLMALLFYPERPSPELSRLAKNDGQGDGHVSGADGGTRTMSFYKQNDTGQ